MEGAKKGLSYGRRTTTPRLSQTGACVEGLSEYFRPEGAHL